MWLCKICKIKKVKELVEQIREENEAVENFVYIDSVENNEQYNNKWFEKICVDNKTV